MKSEIMQTPTSQIWLDEDDILHMKLLPGASPPIPRALNPI